MPSAGPSRFWVMLGQSGAYSVLIFSHLSRPGSVSGLIASAGHILIQMRGWRVKALGAINATLEVTLGRQLRHTLRLSRDGIDSGYWKSGR